MVAKAHQLLSLREELSILQYMLGEALESYAKVIDACQNKDLGLDQRLSLLSKAKEQVYYASDKVRDMALAAKRLEEDGKQVDLSVVHAAITQMVEIVDQEINGDQATMDRIAQRARQQLLVVNQAATTMLTPERIEAEVLAMDNTVPEVA